MWSFVTPLRLKRANIFLSNYLEQGSHWWFALLFGRRFTNKKIHQNQKNLKKTKKMMMMIWLHQEEKKKRLSMFREKTKKKEKWWTHKRQMNLWCSIIQRSFFQDTITSFWVFTIHICFHTLSLDHDTSIIKPTQIQDWLSVPFKKFKSWKSFWRAERFVPNKKKGKNKNWKNRFWDLLSVIQTVFHSHVPKAP